MYGPVRTIFGIRGNDPNPGAIARLMDVALPAGADADVFIA